MLEQYLRQISGEPGPKIRVEPLPALRAPTKKELLASKRKETKFVHKPPAGKYRKSVFKRKSPEDYFKEEVFDMPGILELYLDYLNEIVRKPGEENFERDVLQTHQAPYSKSYKDLLQRQVDKRQIERTRRQIPGHKIKRTKNKPLRQYNIRGKKLYAPKTKEVRK